MSDNQIAAIPCQCATGCCAHKSDCAVHNGPALDEGECTCSIWSLIFELAKWPKYAAESCEECGGKGFIDRRAFVDESVGDQECSHCADARAVLARLTKVNQ